MFTGIIETLGTITDIKTEKTNIHFTLRSNFTSELQIDQSVAHDGVCLTVVKKTADSYTVTAISETLAKTNLRNWVVGDRINLERAAKIGDRLDGHIVQGHIDQTGICEAVCEQNGSWYFTFSFDQSLGNILIEKGSITVNGVSLTVVNAQKNSFQVAIIPYTFSHTTFQNIQKATVVNLEFDLIGKYITALQNR